jgi:DNA-binding MarR family transcriptional regulator
MNTNPTNEKTLISEARHTSDTCENIVEVSNLCSNPQEQELSVKIKDEVAEQIIKHGLTTAQSKLFFYLLKFDHDGSGIKNIPSLEEIAAAIGISINQVKKSLAKLEELGFYKPETYPKGFWRGKRTSRS